MDATPTPLLKSEDVFKHLVWDQLVDAKIAVFLIAAGLSWWPLGPWLTFVLIKFSDTLFNGFKEVVNLEAIAFVNQAHRAAYDKALVTLKVIAQDKGPESKEFLDARANAKAALSQFVHLGGAP